VCITEIENNLCLGTKAYLKDASVLIQYHSWGRMYTPEYQGTPVDLSLITQVAVHDSTITVRVFRLVSGNQEVPVRRLFRRFCTFSQLKQSKFMQTYRFAIEHGVLP
jgi:hypothetical protein